MEMEPTTGHWSMYTTFSYIWTQDSAGVYSGKRSKIKGTLPDVRQSEPVRELTDSEKELKGQSADIAIGAGVVGLTVLAAWTAFGYYRSP